jgi:hypothetical protein
MRPVKSSLRAAVLPALVLTLWAPGATGLGCASSPRTPPGAASGAAGGGGAPAVDANGAAGSETGTAGGGDVAGAAGSVADPTGAAGMAPVMGTVPSGAGGTVDQGRLFTDAAPVSTASADAGSPTTSETSSASDSGGATIPGDGNTSTCHVGGMSYLLVFTQKGADVTMVVTASNCPTGNHTILIHGGFSCDNASTEGAVWDGKRGDGIPQLACANNKGTLTYTRLGADPSTSWTVGDHSTKTDVTLHPMSVDSSCGTFF